MCTVVRPRTSTVPRQATTQATTIGAFVVLLVGVAILFAVHLEDRSSTTADYARHLPAVFALVAVLGVSVRVGHLIRDLAQLAHTRHQANTDELTGVANRRAVTAHLEEAVAAGAALGLLVLDVDRFKEVNDRHGHTVGDSVLVSVAQRLGSVLPDGALLARLGGDEFAVLVEGPAVSAGVTGVALLADDVVAALAEPVAVEGHLFKTSVSVGVACDGEARDAVELLRQADAAMYVAKSRGGGVQSYDPQIDAAAQFTADRVEQLRAALDPEDPAGSEQFVVHYQPQMDLATGEVSGVEGLVRWQHPEHGSRPGPADFLDLVEQHGLMGEVTARVLWQAAHQAARWRAAGSPLRVSVNLSTSCLADPALLPLLDEVLAGTGLEPALLVLEVTETTVMSDPELAMATMEAITARGVRLSIDDYGTGYLLAYLDHLPAHELKLDRSFTSRLLSDERTAAIVSATVQLAHRLGLTVVAEGVEDDATLRALAEVGWDESQGYLHSRPLSIEQLGPWLGLHLTGEPARGAPDGARGHASDRPVRL